jgi:hypothetical protein
MRRVDLDLLSRIGAHPSVLDAPASEYQRMRALAINDGELDFVIERGG